MNDLFKPLIRFYNASFLDNLLKNNFVLAVLVIANFAGGVLGFIPFFLTKQWYPIDYYHPLLWFFIADCPIYAIIFIVFLFKRDWEWLNGILVVHLIKYGFTGSIIWVIYLPFLVDLNTLTGLVGWSSHLIFMGEGLLVLPFISFKRKTGARRDLLIITSWILLNNFIDFLLLDVLKIFGLFTWSREGPAPHGTMVLYPLTATFMFDLLVIYISIDILLLGIIIWRYHKTLRQEEIA
ncbi:MAG: DUF1405 domain-containing protein [Candidatus Hodarchaeales archaeon]